MAPLVSRLPLPNPAQLVNRTGQSRQGLTHQEPIPCGLGAPRWMGLRCFSLFLFPCFSLASLSLSRLPYLYHSCLLLFFSPSLSFSLTLSPASYLPHPNHLSLSLSLFLLLTFFFSLSLNITSFVRPHSYLSRSHTSLSLYSLLRMSVTTPVVQTTLPYP